MIDAAEGAEDEALSLALLFWLGGGYYAIAAERIVRVVASPLMTVLPFMPREVPGVIAIGGKVVPVLETRALLGLPEAERGGDELVLVSAGAETYGLRVDRVLQTVAGVWSVAIRWRGRPVQLLDVDDLLARGLSGNPATGMVLASLDVQQPSEAPGLTQERGGSCLAVATASAEVHLPLDAVFELSEALAVAAIPDPSPLLAGAAFYRDALLPVICLDALLGHAPAPAQERSAFVIADVDGRRCVLAVKRVIGLASEALHPIPLRELLAEVLPEREPGQPVPQRQDQQPIATGSAYLQVEQGGQTCAFALASIAHIHAACRIDRAPSTAQSEVIGVTAINGRVLPVVDLAARLGLTHRAAAPQCLELRSQHSGTFIVAVDAVAGIVALAPEAFVQPPDGLPIAAIAQRGGKLIWILDAAGLVQDERRPDAA